jgi:hypothetical protein
MDSTDFLILWDSKWGGGVKLDEISTISGVICDYRGCYAASHRIPSQSCLIQTDMFKYGSAVSLSNFLDLFLLLDGIALLWITLFSVNDFVGEAFSDGLHIFECMLSGSYIMG